MEKIYIDLVQTSNFKFQVSFTNIIYFFLLQRYLTRSIIENSSKNIFWKEFFFMENSINIPTRGIIRSRAQSSVSFILDQRTPSKASRKKLSQPSFLLDRYYSLEFENVTEGLKKKKTKTKIKKKQSIFGMEISGMHRENWCWHRQQRRRKASLQPLCDRSSLALFNHPFQSWRVFREIIPTFRDKIILSKEGKDSKHSFDSTLLFLLLMDTRLTFRAMP